MKRIVFVLSVALVLLTACGSTPELTKPPEPTRAPEPTPEPPTSIVDGWVTALNVGDVEAALSYLADDAVLTFVPPPIPGDDGIFSGKEEIRGWYQGLAAGKGVTTLSNCQVKGEQITCQTTYADAGLKSEGIDFLAFEWVATVRDGKIRGYTSTATPETVARLAEPTSVPVTPLPSFVYGGYTTIITKEDVPAGLSSELAAGIPGKYEITYGPDGRMTLVRDGKEMARGTFRLKGDQLLLNADDTGDYACQMFARYTWAIDGKNLMLTKLQDGCDGRVVVIADHPLVLVEP